MPLKMPARNKYRAQPTVVNGWRFDSKRESQRYLELLLLGRAGQIANLELQPMFPLKVGDRLVAVYRADFGYDDLRCRGVRIYEDVKGMDTPVSRLKRKLVAAIYGIDVRVLR